MTVSFKELSGSGAEPVLRADPSRSLRAAAPALPVFSAPPRSAALRAARPRAGGLSTGLYRTAGKRILDVALVLISAPVTLLVVGLLALLAALDGASPFYLQDRIGRGGRRFRLVKIRTMVPDADALLAAHLEADPAARREWDETQKLKNDPRITRFGRFLRKSSLDELPQLWNVLTGDMAIVGPRPMMPQQRALYPGSAYYALRPGITGPWQVSDRNQTAFADRALFDTDYDARLSLATDLRLILETVRVVARGTGY